LKAAAYRGVIGGSGDLMALGAFGIGSEGVSISDWNETPDVNCFLVAASSSTLNKPPGGSTNGFQLSFNGGTFKKQYASGVNGKVEYSR
ncbi:hypothetical protein R0K17_25095, partial [Planococcus sp. SIMBA_143]